MISNQKHSINKIVLEVYTNSTSLGYELKDNLPVFFKDDFLPSLEDYFSSIEHLLPPKIFHIPKLNLEINVGSTNGFEALKTEVKEKLIYEIANILKSPSESKNLILIDTQEREVNSLLFFIEHGYLPWWHSIEVSSLFTIEGFKYIATNTSLQNKLKELLKKANSKKRCILQFSNKELQFLLRAVFNEDEKISVVNQQVVGKLKQLTTPSRALVWVLIIDYLLSKNESVLIQKLHNELVLTSGSNDKNRPAFAEITLIILKQLLSLRKADISSVLQNQFKGNSQKKETIISSILSICNQLGLADTADKFVKSVGYEFADKINKLKFFDTDNSKENTSHQIKNESFSTFNFEEEKEVLETDASYYIQNAGLVITHPYIPRFLQHCGLLDDSYAFTDREMAAHTLHYLATKEEQQLESEMVFEKFICGIPITQSINRHIQLSDTIKNQVEILLKSIIENWGSLGNVSTDLLRHEFLKREGKLCFKDDNPKVIIERKTQDILVDKLPWGISLFKLPWMDKIIYTNW
ncbi:contractile injection system tape measure protein [Mariniflexile sp.]|uniref:contractile injection system tape measure protein n=1 Tax=Mariniflexile sp. TaxID=1979402 RepID=UPI003569CC15